MESVCNLGEVAALWKEEKKVYVKRSTFAAYSLIVRNHLVPVFGDSTDVTEEDVQRFVIDKIGSGLSHKSVKDMLVVLKMILKYASKHGYMPYRQIEVHFPTERDRQELPVLDRDVQRRVMKYVREHFTYRGLGVYICLSAGLRIGEMCALKWDDMDVERGVIKVSKTIQRIYSPDGGMSRTTLVMDSPKSPHSNREIPMTRELISMVRPLKRVVDRDCFVLTNSTRPTEPRTYRNWYRRFQTQLGLPMQRFHGLRHSFATRCIESRCDYKTVSVLLGHSNISTTLNLYVHPDMNQKKRCVEQMFRSLK